MLYLKHVTTAFLLLSAALLSTSYAYAQNKVCAIYPHLKDSYWISVNYGMVKEAEKEGIELKVLESGGYPNISKQKAQLATCKQWGADAIILGTVSPNAYYDQIEQVIGDTPIFSTVNKLLVSEKDKDNLKGQVGVDWYWMGYFAGEYLANKHPTGSGAVRVGWLPGPKTSGGTKPSTQGFFDAIENSDVVIMRTFWADNDKELQRNLIQQALEVPNLDYIVGSAVAIEAAISETRALNKNRDIGLISTYLSHGVYRGLLRNKVLFAPTDKMVLQGQLSLMQASAYLKDKEFDELLSPRIEKLTPDSLNKTIIDESLSPSEFRPIFSIGATK
ncbi:TMAO reductase system periplasmic protein TorT [Vibrio sp. SCSIO 43137]|uniref:TMAO reductase system periplasmic protein TorT n=1 Tax=Vibrio sp. SCSIO 43137 TaxID=3021011 RepID=UPI002306F12D|nr:TMAO reductase system periplasmic protein TorT [Vibrio sp. SCSIO 43137]WCE31442.1 TMAO reductase system periplasmic protein TorT [Vibrio sp. SCSIO 43137]